jgi:SAM-dependent methyltransferase
VDAVERLSLADVRGTTAIATEHLHRYEIAAALCGGLRVADVCCGIGYGSRMLRDAGAAVVVGVDNDRGAIEEARREFGGEGIEFEVGDALSYLERQGSESLDAVVMYEGLEHLADLDRALNALRALAAEGVRLAVSIPNSLVLDQEDNPFHHTDFDYANAVDALRGLGDEVAVLYQFAAEGSLIRGSEAATDELGARSVLPERGEPELASHFIALVNFGAVDLAGGRMTLSSAPVHRRYQLDLERTNARLWDQVDELKGYISEVQTYVAHLEGRLARIESSLPWRASKPLRALLARRERRRRRA